MLKERALDFYYDKISGRLYKFTKIVEITKAHFKTEENRQKYLSKWRETTLATIIVRNPKKSQLECLEILFNKLCTT
jgi:hypothetical protein